MNDGEHAYRITNAPILGIGNFPEVIGDNPLGQCIYTCMWDIRIINIYIKIHCIRSIFSMLHTRIYTGDRYT